jgi:hypothetical protein
VNNDAKLEMEDLNGSFKVVEETPDKWFLKLFNPAEDATPEKTIISPEDLDYTSLNDYGFFLELRDSDLLISPYNGVNFKTDSWYEYLGINYVYNLFVANDVNPNDIGLNFKESHDSFYQYEMSNFISEANRDRSRQAYNGPPPILFNFNCNDADDEVVGYLSVGTYNMRSFVKKNPRIILSSDALHLLSPLIIRFNIV